MSRVTFKEEASVPGTPPTGYIVFYAKTDGLLYFKDDTGTEYAVKGGAALTDIDTLAKLNGVVTDATLVDTADIVLVAATSLAATGFFLDEDDMVSDDDTKVASQQSVKKYVDDQIALNVAGLYDHKGSYDASTNTPDLDTSPSGILKGDAYKVTVAGNFFTEAVVAGDTLIADQDAPTLLTHWTVLGNQQTPAETKTAYESNADTNAFTDAEKTALASAGDLQSDGTVPLAANWAVGGFEISGVTELAGNAPLVLSYSNGLGVPYLQIESDRFNFNISGTNEAVLTAGSLFVNAPVIAGDGYLKAEGSSPVLKLQETAAPLGDEAGYGQYWVKNTVPATPIFTDDAGTEFDLSTGGGGGGMTVTPVKTANYTAAANEVVPVDSSGGAFTITFPAAPDAQDRVIVIDVGKACGTNNVTLGRNGKTLDGVAADFVIDQDNGRVDGSYDGTSDWDLHLIGSPNAIVTETDSGTFTPTIEDTSYSPSEGQTYSAQSGQYIRVGKLVSIWMDLTITSLGTLTAGNGAYIGGLPFTVEYFAPVVIGFASGLAITAGNTVTGYMSPSNDRIVLAKWSATTGTSALLISEVSADGRFLLNAQYWTED